MANDNARYPSVVTGVTVETATSGALSGDGSSGNKLAVGVDGTTIDVNGSNQLEALGAAVAFKTIAVSGQSSIVADAADDTLTIVAGSNITLTTNAGTDTLTIAASGGGSTPAGWTWDATALTAPNTGAIALTLAIPTNVTATENANGDLDAGTYYILPVILDGRGGFATAAETSAVVGMGDDGSGYIFVSADFSATKPLPQTVRLYLGTASGAQDRYIDVPQQSADFYTGLTGVTIGGFSAFSVGTHTDPNTSLPFRIVAGVPPSATNTAAFQPIVGYVSNGIQMLPNALGLGAYGYDSDDEAANFGTYPSLILKSNDENNGDILYRQWGAHGWNIVSAFMGGSRADPAAGGGSTSFTVQGWDGMQFIPSYQSYYNALYVGAGNIAGQEQLYLTRVSSTSQELISQLDWAGGQLYNTSVTATKGYIFPSSDPMVVGAWWNNAGVLTISAAM